MAGPQFISSTFDGHLGGFHWGVIRNRNVGHSCMCILVHKCKMISRVSTQELNCRVLTQVQPQIWQMIPAGSQSSDTSLTLSLTVEESSHCSPPSLTLSIIRHFSFLPGEWVCNMNVCGFNWPFPDYSWKQVSFYVFFCFMQIYCKFTSTFGFTLLWRSFLLSNWANIWFNITQVHKN